MAEPSPLRTVRRSPGRPLFGWRSWPRGLAAVAIALALASCDTLFPPPPEPPPPPPPPGKEWLAQPVQAQGGVAGLTATVAYDPEEAAFRGLTVPEGAAIASARDDGAGVVTVSWFSYEPASGPVLTLHWTAPPESEPPAVTASAAFGPDGSPSADAVALGGFAEDGSATPVAFHDGLEELDAGAAAAAACRAADYPSELASYPLGDLDASGVVDVRDVVLLHAAIDGDELAAADAHELFHADLTGDCAYDEADVRQAFVKATVPGAEAAPVAKPPVLTYARMRAGTPVLVGNAGNAPLAGLAFFGVNLNGSGFVGDTEWVIEGQSALWTLASDPNDALGTLRVVAGGAEAGVLVGNVAVLVAGQSNAVGWDQDVPAELRDGEAFPSVRMLANDYRWRPAVEPLDDPTGQLDQVSEDADPGTSAGTTLGRLLAAGDEGVGVTGTGRAAYLIPAALGGSRMTPRPNTNVGWYLGPADLADTDRETLYGSAMYRALSSAGLRADPVGDQEPEGGPVSAVFWYQGESDNSTPDLREDYSGYTAAVFEAMRATLAGATGAVEPVIIYAQLAAYGCCLGEESPTAAYVEQLRSHDIAERQRRLEEGAFLGTPHLLPDAGLGSGVQGAHMVVTHDLPRFDRIHLSAEAQQVLAMRVALAYEEHVLGWDVDGTGPRLVSLARSGATLTLTFDREVTPPQVAGPSAYSGYFTAWNGAPDGGPDYSSSYGGNELAIADVARHPSDARKVVITLASDPGTGPVYLRYMRPHEPTSSSDYLEDVIRGLDSGLPLPSFGPLRVG